MKSSVRGAGILASQLWLKSAASVPNKIQTQATKWFRIIKQKTINRIFASATLVLKNLIENIQNNLETARSLLSCIKIRKICVHFSGGFVASTINAIGKRTIKSKIKFFRVGIFLILWTFGSNLSLSISSTELSWSRATVLYLLKYKILKIKEITQMICASNRIANFE